MIVNGHIIKDILLQIWGGNILCREQTEVLFILLENF